jgi:hypothetical protein
MPDNLKIALEKMFSYSPYKYSDDFVKQDKWHSKYKWTQSEEDEFVKWLSEFLKNNWQGISDNKLPDKRFRDKTAEEFVFLYGWNIKYE